MEWRTDHRSWGGVPAARHLLQRPDSQALAAALAADGAPTLAVGGGRSYGDVGLNPEGRLLDCRGLDRFIAFDRTTGQVRAEAGVRLADILVACCRPEADGGGWFLPVSPGTRYVTLAGAIANDVHGKNHHVAGSFGRHVLGLELARSDGPRLHCSAAENPGLFAATIGGLGLTGVILNATLQLRRVAGLAMESEDIRFGRLEEFFALDRESAEDWEYTAAWVDCLAGGAALGRGIYTRARHAPGQAAAPPPTAPRRAVPFTPPLSLVNGLSLRIFNALYYHRLGRAGRRRGVGSYEPVLYPLDAIGGWNRLYGPAGFYQFQCVVPPAVAAPATAELLRRIAAAGQGSMLVVLKRFGALASPGLLSFPMPGVTLALDFPNRGAPTRRLYGQLEAVVAEAGGRLYPAKDALMSAESFARGYPGLATYLPYLDPGLTSGFARRVGLPVAPA